MNLVPACFEAETGLIRIGNNATAFNSPRPMGSETCLVDSGPSTSGPGETAPSSWKGPWTW